MELSHRKRPQAPSTPGVGFKTLVGLPVRILVTLVDAGAVPVVPGLIKIYLRYKSCPTEAESFKHFLLM